MRRREESTLYMSCGGKDLEAARSTGNRVISKVYKSRQIKMSGWGIEVLTKSGATDSSRSTTD